MNWNIKKFNQFKVEEVYKILALRNKVFIVEQECAYLDCDDKDLNSYHLFSEENGEVVAYLRILEKGVSYDEISIGRVVVKRNYRGKGIAREMLLKAIEFIENTLKEDTIKIQAQAYLLNFYSSLGFKAVSEEYLEDNIPHIDMLYKK
ncbi:MULTISPECIES: GNAT family N-acetyltransferase [Clostridium]|uniref:Acyltransferase n=3 Tax=Clostridium TaxID=1485 RepID=D8GMZ1_CLOLD|nr:MULTISPECIES: GNAT family N-acetyltransferase [Clostridium]ADK15779.1 predicted acetyltransferase [Clostridium ljungdahlii DSM 13528]AGY75033.1 GNAT family N-acetyltransferase [Clostridium autoethanogenum DSM 10061]ALU35207.1 GNAT family GCN5-related N-acetyltransferase [Clostridium autoethanogenum DSM 10061]OAA86409.1 putative acyltransferase [Clostridium ljungdahlii DSM 13528]OAA90997.1 putative acyltransferase [Clostridium coskatii]